MKIINKFYSPNYSVRDGEIKYIILHYTELDFEQALARLCAPSSEVSCHYLIKVTGEILQLVPDYNVAWHAGKSFWQGREKLNDNSIGIELDNLGNTLFDQRQMAGCLELCLFLQQKYNLEASAILGHSDIAPDRKIDPGIFFDWQYLANAGIGLWPKDKIIPGNDILLNYGDYGDRVLAMQQKLQKLGYKIELTGYFDQQTNYVVRAFQSHFNQKIILEKGLSFYQYNEARYSWDSGSNAILSNLLNEGV